jgi:GTP-binding protein HflX
VINKKVLLTDTVGFIRKLPHNLIDAFRSTLEEVCYADYIIHVVDASSVNREVEMKVVYETLDMLFGNGHRNKDEAGVEYKKIITLFNKIDKVPEGDERRGLLDKRASKVLCISTKDGIGLEEIGSSIESLLREDRSYIETLISYKEMSRLSEIKTLGEVIEEEYREDGIWIRAYIPKQIKM